MTGFPIPTERKYMEKKPQNTAGDRNEDPAPQGSKWLDKTIIRYITRALVLLIVFAWALVNLDAVLRFLGKVLALFTPFLIGGAIAFLINVVLRPLECCWNKVCRKAPAKLVRPVCLTASTVLFNELVLSDKLFEHCAEIDEAARNRMELIVRSLAEQNGVTEQLKAENQMEWVRQMNACKAQAEEVVKFELIYD